MTIRAAVAGEVPLLVEMGRQFRASSSYAAVFGDNPAQLAALAARLVDGPASVVLVAEDRGGALVGMIGLLGYPQQFSGAWVVGELMWWVDPVHRGGVGVRLLAAAERWARAEGATQLQMVAPMDAARVQQLYARLGFAPLEVTYVKALPVPDAAPVPALEGGR